MLSSSRALSGALLLACSTSALAQSPTTAPAATIAPSQQTAVIVGDPAPNVLRAGTKVLLKMSEPLTTEGKKLRVGQRFQLEVAEPVTINDQVVIPAGSPAIGEVTDVRNKGMWGKSGRINARVLSVRANGRQIRMTGAVDDKGVTGTAGVVAAIAFVPVAGFFTTGTSARIPLGAPVTGFLDEDLTVAFAPAAAPQPMVIPAAAPAAAPVAAQPN
jgi:hypothetical protein